MNSRNPKISVVIPALNEERYLPACLHAFKQQTFKDFEIIVVDNNSTDKTAEIARSFGARVLNENKIGTVFAREKGFEEARAEIIARTDADTIVSSNWLEIIYTSFQKDPQLVGISGIFILPNRSILSWLIYIYLVLIFDMSAKLFLGHIQLLGSNMAVRKSAWKKIRKQTHTNEKFVHEDLDLSCHLSAIGKLTFTSSLSTTFSPRRLKENILSGVMRYVVEYPFRYFYTIFLHHPYFRRHQLPF
ncbi:glycosyltransferase family 2 protein [Candidatus Gottesmanbacteria bacterium]|nr:glycosyltransferase family 2 protein [Candidatus Gottesmanbacteria bacterium]